MKEKNSTTLKKDFMKSARKATLILLLAVGVAMPTFTVQAANAANLLPPATESSQVDHSPYFHTVANKPDSLTTLNFVEVKKPEDLAKKYPFLKPEIDDMIQTNKDSQANPDLKITPTVASIATFHDKSSNLKFVFLKMNGSIACGSLGCSLEGYVDQGNGYKKSLNVVVGDDVRLLSANGKVSVILHGGEGYTQWDLQGNEFQFTKKLTDNDLQQPSPRPGPR